MKPKLVVLTSHPSTGKSRISKYLERKHSFRRLGTDDISEELGYQWQNPDMMNPGEYKIHEHREEAILDLVQHRKMNNLKRGRNVVIDSCALYEGMRARMLSSVLPPKILECDRYLVYVKVDRRGADQRNHARRGIPIDGIFDHYWEEPSGDGLITLENNTKWDYRRALRKLEQELGLK